MKKKTDDEFGILITREMKSMLLDGGISYENRAKIMCSIIGGEELEDPMMKAFADSLRTGFVATNNKRKAEILSRRDRQKSYQRELRKSLKNVGVSSTVDECASTDINVDISTVDECASTEISKDARASLNKAKQSKVNISPLSPPKGDCGDGPEQISADDLLPEAEERRQQAKDLAEWIEQTEAFGHMRANRGRLIASLVSCLKKNSAAEIRQGYEKHSAAWKEAGWKYMPKTVTNWLNDQKYLELLPEEEKTPAPRYEEIGVKEIV